MTQAKNPGGVLPLMGSIVSVFLLFLSTVPAISATFTDTFDNPAFTSSNWMDFPTGADQTWRFTTLSSGDTGYHATTTAPGPPAAKSADSGMVGIYGGPEVTFDDFTVTGTPVGQTDALSRTQVSQLYVSIFGRASEGGGNTYWRSWPDMAAAANAMLETTAAKNYFGAALNTSQAFIEHIYLNTLNKTIADDAAGIAYWVDMLDKGTSRGQVVASLVGVIENYAPGGPYHDPDDAATVAAYNQFTNRVTVSDYMARTVWDPPADWEISTAFAHGLTVTDNAATVNQAKYAIDGFGPAIPTAPWPMYRNDARNTGRSPYAGPSTAEMKWRFLLPNIAGVPPVVGLDGTIYIGLAGMFAVNPDGTEKWSYSGHAATCAPAISSDGTIYMPGYREINAFNPDGTLKWTYWAQNTFNYSSPCIGPDGTLYVGSGIDLLAISPDGQLLWQYRVGESVDSKASVAPDGTIYVRSRTDYLCALNPDGSEKWRLELGSGTFGGGLSPVIADDGTIYTNGIAPYTRTNGGHTSDVNGLFAIRPDSTVKWIFNAISPAGTGTGGFDPALDASGNLYLGGRVNDLWSTNAMFALDPSGNLLWTYQLPQTDYIGKSAPLVDKNGVVYFGTTDHLFALNPQGGLKWKLRTKINNSSLAMDSDGTLYFGTEDGYLNAVGSIE